jgi:hypothetical protein
MMRQKSVGVRLDEQALGAAEMVNELTNQK